MLRNSELATFTRSKLKPLPLRKAKGHWSASPADVDEKPPCLSSSSACNCFFICRNSKVPELTLAIFDMQLGSLLLLPALKIQSHLSDSRNYYGLHLCRQLKKPAPSFSQSKNGLAHAKTITVQLLSSQIFNVVFVSFLLPMVRFWCQLVHKTTFRAIWQNRLLFA